MLSGYSTIDGFLGGGMNDPANVAASEQEEMAQQMPPEEMGPTQEQLDAEKDQALAEQGMRLMDAQNKLTFMQGEISTLNAELNAVRQEALEKQAMLEQQMAEPVAPAEGAVVPNDGPRASAPNGGYGLHVASYELQESVSPGLRNIERRIPVLTNGRPIKIANATVRGRNFLRLIIGQFDRQSDAAAECQQALLLIDFCEVIAFEGEDY
ncbi:MAG: hypothetical protein HOJ34_09510 [Kordiimonadaceae bacterium]|nr:hypothetical protein [Kordiimonadaceae bacterium]